MKKFLLLAASILLLAACNKKENESVVVTLPSQTPLATTREAPTTTKPSPTPSPTEDLTGKKISPLTGNYIDEEFSKRRPFAIVFNNIKEALPQSGISQGEIFYEVLAEAGITRIIALSQNYTSERIGSIRSARHYFLDFVLDNDAIFVHHGGSAQAYKFIANNNIKDINGDLYDGTYFYRDKEKRKIASREHTSFTKTTLLEKAVENLKIAKYYPDDFKTMFQFYEKDSNLLAGLEAQEVSVPFSTYQVGKFVYDKDKKIYLRFQRDEKHIDEENNEQLYVKNIIVQNVKLSVIDDYGRRDAELVGSGDGYLFSNGKYVKITWSKDSHFSQTKWFDENGSPLKINKGKTWICVFQKSGELDIIGSEDITSTQVTSATPSS